MAWRTGRKNGTSVELCFEVKHVELEVQRTQEGGPERPDKLRFAQVIDRVSGIARGRVYEYFLAPFAGVNILAVEKVAAGLLEGLPLPGQLT